MHSFQTITKLISMQQTDKHPSSTCLLRCSSRIQRTSFHFNSHNVANGKNRRTEWYVVLQIFDVYVFIHYSHCMSYVENWIYFSTCINFISHCSWQSILLARYTVCCRVSFRSFVLFSVFGYCCCCFFLLVFGCSFQAWWLISLLLLAFFFFLLLLILFILLHLCHFSHSYLIHYAFEFRSALFVQSFLYRKSYVTLTLLLHEIQSE